ncbi:uncharacterized protein LAESUDRAFT_762972 [Laetiporus sulphureus 93-53]|uniref:Uncharacterized protein n=1 Tax=Laetiporus sulphureus 93-53 TaxID=1314785 RepID=A0A165C4W5_9APHY|nr:uncharacterized protein LAESUDRAFT_762972 [Laetiporus sulphureus 93-53]KZT02209.1 hypothetical protein LAESUDRAFT_762972 [Laetiporus sulphureus 93-53]
MQRATSQSSPLFLSLTWKLSRPNYHHHWHSSRTSSLSSLSSSLDALISYLPAFENSARSIAKDTREMKKERRKAALVLEHDGKLYAVLSLLLLLDFCVRNHNYADVLLLALRSNSLS